MGKFLFIATSVVFVAIAARLYTMLRLSPAPVLEENTYWGPGAPSNDDIKIKPFNIYVPDEVIEDLKDRLNKRRPVKQSLENSSHTYGINSNLLEEILKFWQTKYEWREREKFLNRMPQFRTEIQGLNVHYLHAKPENADKRKVLPLLLLHGWPGSVREFYEMIPMLTEPRDGFDFVFEVIAPSLPGFGFSDGASKTGLGAAQIATLLKNFMKRLGHDKFYLQGGDWGAVIASHMAAMFKDNVIGMHSNLCYSIAPIGILKLFLGSLYPAWIVDEKYEDRVYPLGALLSNLTLETGYLHMQSTKPDTVGVALNDSPAGLAAYILEKFIFWTKPDYVNENDGGLKKIYKYEDLLDNVMIYWITNSITTSARLYSETFRKSHFNLGIHNAAVDVPTACSYSKYEVFYQPPSILKHVYRNLVHHAVFDDGGHFVALQVPKLLADDIWIAMKKIQHAVGSET